MNVLVACEFSGVVRRAFRERGHNAWSCDLLPAEDGSPYHIQGDALELLDGDWELLIAHPPCTDLASSGARWFKEKKADGRQQKAIEFFMQFVNAPIEHICIENPVGVMSTVWRKPDCIVNPWQFGDPFQKTTCLWLRNLPPLQPTNIVEGREQKCWKEPPHPDRWKRRSRTYSGIAKAMAKQWSLYD